MLQTVQANGATDVELRESGPGAGPAQPAAMPILVQYWQVFLRWKWVIAGILAAALAIALIVTLLTTPVYTATARVDISREQKNVTSVEGLESREAFRDDEFYQTQYSLLEARSLAERVVRARNLASNDAFFEAHGVSQDGGLFGDDRGRTLGAEERRQREQLAIGLLLQNVTIRPIPRSRLVDVRYTSASPTMSAEIANAWVEQFIAGSLDRRFASTADARRFLEGRLAELGQRLEASERAVVRYAREHDIVSLGRVTGPDGRVESDRTLVGNDLEALNAALTQATADRIAWESRLRNSGGNSAEVPAKRHAGGPSAAARGSGGGAIASARSVRARISGRAGPRSAASRHRCQHRPRGIAHRCDPVDPISGGSCGGKRRCVRTSRS